MSTIAIAVGRVRGRRVLIGPTMCLAAAKVLVAGVLGASLLIPAAGGFHAEALWLRGAVYPVGLAMIPAAWLLRGRRSAYPLGADAYLVIPFAFDAAGNSLGLYQSVNNFDNIAHLVGTFALTGFAGSLLRSRSGDRLLVAAAAAGVASMLAIGIEVAEWTAFAHPVGTGFQAYRDTIGDLAMDVAGVALGGLALAVSRAGRAGFGAGMT